MYRIDDPSASATLPTPEAALTEGYWTEGNPGTGTPATLERASWFNMIQEELRAIVIAGGLTPSKTTYTQVRDAIQKMYSPPIGTATNLKCVLGAVATTLPYSADQVVVGASLGGQTFCLSNLSANISALDTGTLAANSFYAAYAYLKSDGTTGGFLQLEPSGGATTVYGGTHPPVNMVASALVGIWPTNGSSQFIAGSQYGRRLNFAAATAYNGSGAVSLATVSLASIVPKAAKFASGLVSITVSTTGISSFQVFDQTAVGSSSVTISVNTGNATGGGNSNNYNSFPILTSQTWYLSSTQSATISNMNVGVIGYEF